MISTFKSYLTEDINSHMTHIENLVFDGGVDGTRKAIFFMRDIRDMLTQGTAKGKISTKFDGAPAVVTGINPENGKFFIAKKGIFNKNPKLYYSHSDIMSDTTGDLAHKLMVAFDECAKLDIKKGIFQGDIMFTKDSLKTESIDGVKYITFHPNTILYAIPHDSELGKYIMSSNIGIVWHTSYSGNTINSLSAKFTDNITKNFRKSLTSWMINAIVENVTSKAMFTEQERKEFDSMLSEIGKLFQSMNAQTLNSIHKNEELRKIINTYDNIRIRSNKNEIDVNSHVDGLYDYVFQKMTEEKTKRKTEKGKLGVDEKMRPIMEFLSFPKKDIVKIFDLVQKITTAKEFLIKKLNKLSEIKTFLKTKNGFRVTNQEGFVAINDTNAVKLVSRLEFSFANFSPDILKGWSSK